MAIKRLKVSKASSGFTLLEVLITVVIFSIGLLGLAGLQATGIKLNHSSLLRTQATLLANDVADCMRTNRGTVGNYALGMNDGLYGTPDDQAQRDINNWLQTLDQMLPSGDGSITLDGNRATIAVRWDDTRGVGEPKTFTLVTDI